MGRRQPGLLARLFCLAPHARVRHLSDSSNGGVKKYKSTPGKAADGEAPSPADVAADSPLAAYLGKLPPQPFGAPSSHATSSSAASSSTSSAALVAAWISHGDTGYDADSDIEEESASDSRGRRFAPATRHSADRRIASASNEGSRRASGQAAEVQQAAQTPAASSSSGTKAASSLADLCPSPFSSLPPSASCGNLAGLAAPAPGRRSYSRQQSRDGSVLTAADGSSSSATASSISLAHLLAPGPSGGSSGRRRLRRLGSTQVVVSLPGSPGPGEEGAQEAPPGRTAAKQGATAGQPAVAAAGKQLQRRLTDMHSGHFISLQKLQEQCGDPEGEGRAVGSNGGWVARAGGPSRTHIPSFCPHLLQSHPTTCLACSLAACWTAGPPACCSACTARARWRSCAQLKLRPRRLRPRPRLPLQQSPPPLPSRLRRCSGWASAICRGCRPSALELPGAGCWTSWAPTPSSLSARELPSATIERSHTEFASRTHLSHFPHTQLKT